METLFLLLGEGALFMQMSEEKETLYDFNAALKLLTECINLNKISTFYAMTACNHLILTLANQIDMPTQVFIEMLDCLKKDYSKRNEVD